MVCISPSRIRFDAGSCPCYSYRRLTQGVKVFPDPIKVDERITLNQIICEIHNCIEAFKYWMLTKVWNGINSLIVYRISSSAVVPSLFICVHTDVHYVPRKKEHKDFFLLYFACSYLGEENMISVMLKSTEQKADVGRSPHFLADFCFHPFTTSCTSSGKRTWLVCCCRRWSSFSPPFWILLLSAGGVKHLCNLEVCFCLSRAKLDPVPHTHLNARGSSTLLSLWR